MLRHPGHPTKADHLEEILLLKGVETLPRGEGLCYKASPGQDSQDRLMGPPGPSDTP